MGASDISRAAEKLAFALDHFGINVNNRVAVDLGCGAGGFTAVLLERGAIRVYAVDTGYGQLAWKIRQDPRVSVFERTNALYVKFPEKADIAVIDVGWTRQKLIIPRAMEFLKIGGDIVSLLKPHYEAEARYAAKRRGMLKEEESAQIAKKVIKDLESFAISVKNYVLSPVTGEKGGNREYFIHIHKN